MSMTWMKPVLDAARSPKAREAVVRMGKLAADNPAVARAARDLVERARVSLEGVRKARTPEARITKKLSAVEEMMADSGGHDADLAGWDQRVRRLRQALRIAESQTGRERTATLETIDGQADALLAAVISSLLGGSEGDNHGKPEPATD